MLTFVSVDPRSATRNAADRARRRRCHLVAAGSAVVVSVLMAGCGSVAAVDTFETHDASASAVSACTTSGAAICRRARACSPFWFDRIYTSVETCSAVFSEKCVDRYRGEGAATTIADCSATVGSLSCEELLDPVVVTLDPSVLLDSCPVTPGLFAAGDRCLRDGDCTTERCVWHGGCGRCEAPLAPPPSLRKDGDACSSSNTCASRWCSASFTCAPTAKLGEPCADRPCDILGGLTCGSDSVCRPFGDAALALGQACSLGDGCVTGALCLLDENFSHGTCQAAPSAGGGADCASGCARELRCSRDGKCAAPTPGGFKSCAPPTSTSAH